MKDHTELRRAICFAVLVIAIVALVITNHIFAAILFGIMLFWV